MQITLTFIQDYKQTTVPTYIIILAKYVWINSIIKNYYLRLKY